MTLQSCKKRAIYRVEDATMGVEFFVCHDHRKAFFSHELTKYAGRRECGHEGNVEATETEVKAALRKTL